MESYLSFFWFCNQLVTGLRQPPVRIELTVAVTPLFFQVQGGCLGAAGYFLGMASARKGFTFRMPGQMVIASFMLRFVKEKDEGEAAGAGSRWRVYLRHIQSGKEQYFATLQAAFSFLEEYLAKDETGEEVLGAFGGNQ